MASSRPLCDFRVGRFRKIMWPKLQKCGLPVWCFAMIVRHERAREHSRAQDPDVMLVQWSFNLVRQSKIWPTQIELRSRVHLVFTILLQAFLFTVVIVLTQ